MTTQRMTTERTTTEVPTRRSDVRVGVPTGAVPPNAAPVEHDLPGEHPVLARRYRAGDVRTGAFGRGFRTLLDLALVPVDGHVVVEFPDRRSLRFVPTSTGWLCTAGPHHELTVAEHTWRLAIDTGGRAGVAEFDERGHLTAWSSPAASVLLRRDRRGRAIAIDDGRHRLELAWDGGHVVQVTTGRGQTATYAYGTGGAALHRLVRVRRPDGVVSYSWHDGCATRRHLAAVC